MTKIKILEIKSELGAGTRGASMGIDAIKTAALNSHNNIFGPLSEFEIPHENNLLSAPTKFPHALYIDGIATVYKNVSETVAATLNQKIFPVILSGDHASAGGVISGIKKTFPGQRTGVIWIDAHADLHTPYTSPSGHVHGMPLAAALNEDNLTQKRQNPDSKTIHYWNLLKQTGGITPKILPEDIALVALRSSEKEEDHLIRDKNIHTITVEDVRRKGTSSISEQILQYLKNCDLLYLSFDVDSLDPSLSKGTGTPVEKGLWKEEALQLILSLLQDPRVCGFEITEVNPTLDTENKMAVIAYEILKKAVKVIQKKAEKES